MAVAILYGAEVLHSLDTDFLSLDGSPIVDGLAIKLPQTQSGQGLLILPSVDDDEDEAEPD